MEAVTTETQEPTLDDHEIERTDETTEVGSSSGSRTEVTARLDIVIFVCYVTLMLRYSNY